MEESSIANRFKQRVYNDLYAWRNRIGQGILVSKDQLILKNSELDTDGDKLTTGWNNIIK